MTRSIPSYAHRDFIAYVSYRQREGDLEAARLMAKLPDKRAASRRKKDRGPRAKGKTKAERKAATKDETAQIRAECVKRAGGVGELCGKPLDMERAELCHLDGGIGSRTQNQSVRNCVMEHHECHQGPTGFDKKPMAWFGSVQGWAWRHGYEVPGKYQRLFALRNTPSVPVEIVVKEGTP